MCGSSLVAGLAGLMLSPRELMVVRVCPAPWLAPKGQMMKIEDNAQSGPARELPVVGDAFKISARRKLLRGVFAVPAVLTLHSGSAFAQASVSCLKKANDAPSPVTPGPADLNDLAYIRIRLWKRVRSNVADQFWVSGADFGIYARPNLPSFISVSQWQRFNVTQNKLFTGENQPQGSQPTPGTWTHTGPYVVLRIDQDGAVVGLGTTGGGVAVGQSCWNSFAMM